MSFVVPMRERVISVECSHSWAFGAAENNFPLSRSGRWHSGACLGLRMRPGQERVTLSQSGTRHATDWHSDTHEATRDPCRQLVCGRHPPSHHRSFRAASTTPCSGQSLWPLYRLGHFQISSCPAHTNAANAE